MIIDLTHTMTPEIPVYPGTEAPVLKSAHTIHRDGWRETSLTFSSHVGTHMDAPSHFLKDGSNLEDLPVSHFCGRAIVVDLSEREPGSIITENFLRKLNGKLLSVDFALFYTGWERRWGTNSYYDNNYPVLDEDAARYLVRCGMKGVGIDTLSVDPLNTDDYPAHHILLNGGMVIVENLCLRKIAGREDVMFFALPLKYKNADGAPVRAIAEFRDFTEKGER